MYKYDTTKLECITLKMKESKCLAFLLHWSSFCSTTQATLLLHPRLEKGNEACFVTPQTTTANYLINGYHCNHAPGVDACFIMSTGRSASCNNPGQGSKGEL